MNFCFVKLRWDFDLTWVWVFISTFTFFFLLITFYFEFMIWYRLGEINFWLNLIGGSHCFRESWLSYFKFVLLDPLQRRLPQFFHRIKSSRASLIALLMELLSSIYKLLFTCSYLISVKTIFLVFAKAKLLFSFSLL